MEYDTIVLGHSVGALHYALCNSYPLIMTNLAPPSKLSYVGYKPEGELYNQMIFLLSLSGLLPFGGKEERINIIDENTLEVTTNSLSHTVKFSRACVVDEWGVTGLPLPEKQGDRFKVIDWFDGAWSSPMEDPPWQIDGDGNFVKEVAFLHPYTKDKNCSQHRLAAISYLTAGQVQDEEYSFSNVRMKVQRMMEKEGFRGQYNGIKTTTGTPRYYRIGLKFSHREVFPVQKSHFKNTENITFIEQPSEEIIDSISFLESSTTSYSRRLWNSLKSKMNLLF